MSENPVKGALLVGSIPGIDNEEQLFKYVSNTLGKHLKRIPDGELRERNHFVAFQRPTFAPCGDAMRQGWANKPRHFEPDEKSRILSQLPDKLSTTYDSSALNSFAVFDKLQAAGIILPEARLQVCIPTPVNSLYAFIEEELVEGVYPLYERSLFADIERIQASIPHDKLAIQWDVAVDLALVEDKFYDRLAGGKFKTWFSDVQAGVIECIVRCVNVVHDDVEVGLHLCYGDVGHKHFVEPRDLGVCVAVANGIMREMRRPLTWLHVPVPKDRHDEEYFAPLKDLEIHGGKTELYLGLVHPRDEEGTRRRIKAASKFVKSFGVATECGMGRTPLDEIDSIFELSAAVAQPWT